MTLNDNDIVAVSETDFITNALSIIDETSPRTLQNYLVWRFMMNQAELNMPRNIRNIEGQFSRVLLGTNAEQLRTVKCGTYVNYNMGFVVSKLYINSYFDENARNEVMKNDILNL